MPKKRKMHGLSRSRIYKLYYSIKSRCYYTKSREYSSYGGKGIKMCEEWKNNIFLFIIWAYKNGYKDDAPFGECTLDRINPNGDYEPDNCRWVTIQEQQRTRNSTKKRPTPLTDDEVMEIFLNDTLSVCALARKYNITHSQVYKIKRKLTRVDALKEVIA